MVERAGLDAVHQLARLALGGDEVEEPPAAGRLLVKAQDPPRQDVAAPEIVEQPAVETELAQARLNRVEIEHSRLRKI